MTEATEKLPNQILRRDDAVFEFSVVVFNNYTFTRFKCIKFSSPYYFVKETDSSFSATSYFADQFDTTESLMEGLSVKSRNLMRSPYMEVPAIDAAYGIDYNLSMEDGGTPDDMATTTTALRDGTVPRGTWRY